MKQTIEQHHKGFLELLQNIAASDIANSIEVYQGIDTACEIIMSSAKSGGKLLFIGNGGSAAIAGHMAIDFWKNGGIQALTFNDGPLLTCISNDFGYKHVFEKPIEMFASEGDVLFAISSSGQSENILTGVEAARSRGCKVITLSGFKSDNPLRVKGDLNFYVPSAEYGPVEVAHQYICHWILDTLMSVGKQP